MIVVIYFLAVLAFVLTLVTGIVIGLLVDQAFMHQYLKDSEDDYDFLNVTIEDTEKANEKFMKSDFTYKEFQDGPHCQNN